MELENELWKIFENVNSWLEFAEKKNGALAAALGVGTVVGLIGNPQMALQWTSLNSISRSLGILLLVLGWLISLCSFIPKTQLDRLLLVGLSKPDDQRLSDNLFFYKDIAKYDQGSYLKSLSVRYELSATGSNSYADHLSAQIVINSGIALRKYELFTRAMYFVLVGFVGLLFSVLSR